MGKKDDLLGMPFGTACNRLRKSLLWYYVKNQDDDTCFRCGSRIETIHDLSIEHKEPWMSASDPIESFFDINNIAFSHLSCNNMEGAKTGGKLVGGHNRSHIPKKERSWYLNERKIRKTPEYREKNRLYMRKYRAGVA